MSTDALGPDGFPRIELRPEHWNIVRDILREVVSERDVWAFGSRALFRAKKHSDLDLAILGEEALSLTALAALRDAFAESDLPFRVDVVDWATTDEGFRRIIERDRVVVQTARRS
ncbi:MAG: nucleotidyltransferase domain-containing protein [Myxococcota bacterium]